MNNNDQDNSKDLLTNKPEATFSNGTNITGSSDDINKKKINLNDESQSHLIESSIEEQNQDEFIRITAAHQMLIEGFFVKKLLFLLFNFYDLFSSNV